MRTTIVLDDTLYAKLKALVPQRRISHFINYLIEEKIKSTEKKVITKRMKDGYISTLKSRKDLESEWDTILAEGWK